MKRNQKELEQKINVVFLVVAVTFICVVSLLTGCLRVNMESSFNTKTDTKSILDSYARGVTGALGIMNNINNGNVDALPNGPIGGTDGKDWS